MTPQDRVTKSHIAIMRSKEFCLFSGILSIGDVNFQEDIPTAATNGRDVVYNPKFIDTLQSKELNFIVLHEAIHKAFQHMHLWKGLFKQNPMVANMAADYIVNQTIVNADPNSAITVMPSGALYDKRFEGWSTRQVFDTLIQENPDMNQEYQLDVHDWDGAEKLDDDEVNKVKKQIDTALRQGEILRGKMGGNQSRAINDLLKPKVNWRHELRQFMNNICSTKDKSSWRRPHRRFVSQDIYMPSMIGESVGDLVIGIDTSGSIRQKDIQAFLSEVVNICEDVIPKTVHLLYWDYDVAGAEKYKQHEYGNMLKSTKPVGGGGTEVGCVNKYLDKHKIKPEAVLIFTDGYVEEDWGGTWKYPTLWVVTSKEVSPHGKTINYEGED